MKNRGEICNAAWLSQYIKVGLSCGMCKSLNKYNSQVISQVVVAIDLYSASAEDLETTSCFFYLQEIRASPKKTQ